MVWDGSRNEGTKFIGFTLDSTSPWLLLLPVTHQFVATWALWNREQSSR